MLTRQEIVVLHKIDLVPETERIKVIENQLGELGIQPIRVSGATGEGIPNLIRSMHQAVEEAITNELAAASESEMGEPGR